MRAALAWIKPRLQRRRPWRRLLLEAGLATAGLLAGAHWLTERYGIGIDPQRHVSVRADDGGVPRLYLLSYRDRELSRGEIVSVALPDRAREQLAGAGFALASSSLMKRVAGMPGDQVRVDADGVWVRLATGLALAPTLKRRPESFYRAITLGPEEYFLLGDTTDSFDARYWGPVRKDAIRGSATILYAAGARR